MRNLFLSSSLLGAGLMLSSCSMIPAFEEPSAPVAPVWTTESQKLDQDQLANTIPWREFFQSPALQEVIGIALENNQDLRIAALNIKRMRAQYNIQRADLYPHVSGAAEATLKGQPRKQTGADDYDTYELYDVGLASASWEIDLFGRISSLSDAALNTYLGTEEAQKSLTISLIAETANAYLQLLSDQENHRLARDTFDAQFKTYELVKSSYANGVVSKLDVAQSRMAVESARATKVVYSRRIREDLNALYLLLGVPEGSALPQERGLKTVALLQDIPIGLPSQVLLQRPDIRQAEYAIRTANGDIGAARANFFPRITLTGSAGFSSQHLDSLFGSGAAGAWTLLPSIQLPIFTAGQNQAELESAEVSQEIAVAEYEQAIQVAFREVADELAARDTLSLQLEAQVQLVDASREAYDLALRLYKQGISSFLNVLDNQRSLFEAQQAEIDVKRQHLTNQINLYKVLGGGVMVPLVEEGKAAM